MELDIIYCEICGHPINESNYKDHAKCRRRRDKENKHHVRRKYSRRQQLWNWK